MTDSFTSFPPLIRICIITFLGNDIVNLDTAMSNLVGREELLNLYPESEIAGMRFTTDPLPAWNDKSSNIHHNKLCKGLQWVNIKGIKALDFTLNLRNIPEGKVHADHLWLLIHRRMYAMAAEIIKRCQKSYNINKSNKYFRTPLSYAASDPEASELIQLLCSRKDVDLNCRDRVGRTPCMWAAMSAAPSSLSALLGAGAEVQVKDKNGETALHFAALGGSLLCVKLLIENMARVNAFDKALNTPLMNARNDTEIIDYLRLHGGESQHVILARRRRAREIGNPRDSDDSDDDLS